MGILGRYSYILLPIISPPGSFISAGFAIITLLHEAAPPPPGTGLLPLQLLYLIVPQASRHGFLIFLINFILFCLHCRLGSAVAEGGPLRQINDDIGKQLAQVVTKGRSPLNFDLTHVRCPKSFKDFCSLPLVLNLV